MERGGKRGLSSVITSLIIIGLALVAIIVVWGVVRNIIEGGSKDIFLEKYTINVDVLDLSLQGQDATINIKRNSGQGDFSGMSFIIDNGTDNTRIDKTSLNELETKNYILNLTELSIFDKADISVVILYNNQEGENSVSEPLIKYNIDFCKNVSDTLIVYECEKKNCSCIGCWGDINYDGKKDSLDYEIINKLALRNSGNGINNSDPDYDIRGDVCLAVTEWEWEIGIDGKINICDKYVFGDDPFSNTLCT